MSEFGYPTYDKYPHRKFTGDPKHFVEQVRANVDNDKLTDEQFRDFIRNTLPIYEKKD